MNKLAIVRVSMTRTRMVNDHPYKSHHVSHVVTDSVERAIRIVTQKYGHDERFRVTGATMECHGDGTEVIVDEDNTHGGRVMVEAKEAANRLRRLKAGKEKSQDIYGITFNPDNPLSVNEACRVVKRKILDDERTVIKAYLEMTDTHGAGPG